MIIRSAEFIKSAVNPAHYPPEGLPEVAFAGRSNVGKSSLINTLVNRKRLVKTSATPGRTRLLNFFSINNQIVFVDLPGYGYARVPERVQKTWGPMIETYLSTRTTLKGVVLILDIRRTPGPDENDLMHWMGIHHIPVVPVLTKADKFSKTAQKNRRREIAVALSANADSLICFSAKTRQGKDAVWDAVCRLIGPGEGKPESGAASAPRIKE